jgi:hypothetical protein
VLPNSGDMLPIVARSASGRLARPSPKNSTNLSTTPFLAQQFGDGEHEVGCRRAGRQAAGELEADDVRNQHRHGLTEHRRFRFDAADAPAEHAEAVDHRRVRVGADQRVRVRPAHAVLLHVEHDARQVLDVDLVHDAGVRRHDLEVAERRLAPAQERVALGVAAELDRSVLGERVARAIASTCTSDRSPAPRRQRVDLVRIAAELDHRLAHRGQVDDRGHAGEVLHDHPARRERDLVGRRRFRIPVEQRFDVSRVTFTPSSKRSRFSSRIFSE